MAKFVGGPYDGMDLPFDPLVLKRLNLPEKKHLDEFLSVPDTTSKFSWPHLYELDPDSDEPRYRYVEKPSHGFSS
jgi:hypothetical protein